MKKKLDELKRTFPEPESPMSSPDVNAPSPGNTPPYITGAGYGYNPAAPMNYGQGLQKKGQLSLLTMFKSVIYSFSSGI